jgi:rubredoxin
MMAKSIAQKKFLNVMCYGLCPWRSYKLEVEMEKWKCKICGYIYDPEKGDPDGDIPPNTPFEKLPDTWVCPACGAPKDMFEKA